MNEIAHTLRPVSEDEGHFLLPIALSQLDDRVRTSEGEFTPVSVTHVSRSPQIAQDGSVEFSVAVPYRNNKQDSYVSGFTRIGRIRLQQALTPSSSAPSPSSRSGPEGPSGPRTAASSLPSEAPSGAKEGESSL